MTAPVQAGSLRHRRTALGVRRRRRSAGELSPLGLIPLAVLFVLWQLMGDPRSIPFPPPSTWGVALGLLLERGVLGGLISTTAMTFLVGLLIAVAVGIVVGIAIGSNRILDQATSPIFEFLRILPGPIIVPVAIILFGIGPAVNIGIVAFAAVWPVVFNTTTSLRTMSRTRREVARTLNISGVAWFRKFLLPSIVPGIAIGIRVAAPIALVVTLSVEFITGSGGIGSELLLRQRQYDSASVYGLILVVGAIALIVNAVLLGLERLFLRGWGIGGAR